jgi:hypothetical protein
MRYAKRSLEVPVKNGNLPQMKMFVSHEIPLKSGSTVLLGKGEVPVL